MNSNLFHNIANVASLVLAGATAVLIASGCVQSAAGALDCSASSISPAYTAYAVMALQGLKLAVNVFRDGFSGLTKPQPPVQ
jgi:hypothetical protein